MIARTELWIKMYQDWNNFFVEYFLNTVPKGTPVYLSVDDFVIESVRQSHESLTDFVSTIKQSILSNGVIYLDEIRGFDEKGHPLGVAFLAFTVLVAYRMGGNEETSSNNYFRHFRELLGLPIDEEGSRPRGMLRGEEAEEPLWKMWNHWLLQQGFLPTAKRGNGPTIYIQYPISQTILRQSDRQNLYSLFDVQSKRQIVDLNELVVNLHREKQKLTQHIQSLLFGKENRQRYEIVTETIFEVYEQWQRGECQEKTVKWNRSLTAGLYCVDGEDIEYWLYPKKNKGRQIEHIDIEQYGLFDEERSGWYAPVVQLTEASLTNGLICNVLNSDWLDNIVLPKKDFWILVKDFENEESGIYASWGRPKLGDDFIILCKKNLISQLEHLKNERLLQWKQQKFPFGSQADWVELQGCKIVSENWDGVFIQSQALKEALKPTTRIAISLKGGLYLPKVNAWLVGYLPQVTVVSFYQHVKFELCVSDRDEKIYQQESYDTNQPFPLIIDQIGNYLIRVIHGNEIVEKRIEIVNWDTTFEKEYHSFGKNSLI